jgi:hypothetical protein
VDNRAADQLTATVWPFEINYLAGPESHTGASGRKNSINIVKNTGKI